MEDSRSSGDGRSTTRVDVVDTHPLVRLGLAVALGHAPGLEPGELRSSVDELRQSDGPVIIGLAHGDTGEIAAAARLARWGRPVLVLVPEDWPYAWSVLRQHVAGGLPRHTSPARLVRALNCIVAGRSYWWFERTAGAVRDGGATHLLSAREQELLGMLAVGCSDREIAEQLCISIRTVWSHLERIRVKTGVRGRVELAMLAWRGEVGERSDRAEGA